MRRYIAMVVLLAAAGGLITELSKRQRRERDNVLRLLGDYITSLFFIPFQAVFVLFVPGVPFCKVLAEVLTGKCLEFCEGVLSQPWRLAGQEPDEL